jgi:N utilization substance protein A
MKAEQAGQLVQALREVEREKGISFDKILRGLEDALAAAYKSSILEIEEEAEEEQEPREDVRVTLDPESGDISFYHQYLDEEGSVEREEEVEVSQELVGRIVAQTVKQGFFQKLRDAEREITYEEFAGRETDLVTGIVQQDSHRYTLLDLGKVEALLPVQEQVPAENYRHGERLKAYIVEVRRTTKGPQIIVSRTHPELLKRLFELEVPEVAEGIVEIKAVAREPGHRSKIAVESNEPGVDPVGACVGAKGSRVRQVVNELKGEKIDIVQWSEDPSKFVAKALQPATVKEVRILGDEQTALVVVPDYQLSLAIGKEGQNARLAARLTGWRIDIKSESQFQDESAGPPEAETPVPEPPAAEAPAPETAATPPADEAPEAEPAGQPEQASEAEPVTGMEEVEDAEEVEKAARTQEVAPGEPSPETIEAAPSEESPEGAPEG